MEKQFNIIFKRYKRTPYKSTNYHIIVNDKIEVNILKLTCITQYKYKVIPI